MREFEEDGRPRFVDMGEGSVEELESGGLLEVVLRKMLDSMNQKGKEGKG